MTHDPTVFLVDDDTAVRDSLKLLLETHGLAVRDFASGAELLELGTPRPGDCLVCDVHMPVMSGLDVVETLAKRGVASPAILITGRVDEALRQRARAAGAFLLLEKPFDGDLLVAAITRALGTSSPATAAH
jgi:two-component system, LuxR family, response regulator FixJ